MISRRPRFERPVARHRVASIAQEFPLRDLAVAIDRRQHGSSRKVSNLINMMPLARHEFLVLSDSDVKVERDYLAGKS